MERGTDEESRRRSLAPEGIVVCRPGLLITSVALPFFFCSPQYFALSKRQPRSFSLASSHGCNRLHETTPYISFAPLASTHLVAAIVPVLACVLNQLCARNDQLPVDQTAITKFHALKPPTISIREYLERCVHEQLDHLHLTCDTRDSPNPISFSIPFPLAASCSRSPHCAQNLQVCRMQR